MSSALSGLQRVTLNANEPQFLGSADQARAISNQAELKAILLRETRDGCAQRREAARLELAVRVHKQQDRTLRNSNSQVSVGRDSGVRLPDQSNRLILA